MTIESSDPRFGVIRELLASLIGSDSSANQTTETHLEYDLDCIVEDLSKLVEQRRAQLEILPIKDNAESFAPSLQAFHHFVDKAADAVFWTNQDGSFAYVNAQACKALGYLQEELLGMHLWDIDPDFPRDRWEALWKKRQENKEAGADQLETFHRRKDGSFFPVDILSTHLWLEDTEVQASVVRDATTRKQTESRLRESEAHYRALIESQVDLISRYRPDCTLTFVNNAYCEFYGRPREALVGHSYLEMVAPEFHDLSRKETEDLVKNPRPISGEYLNYAANGDERWIQWVILPIVDDDGQVVELQGVGRDITRLKQTEAALRQKYEEEQKFRAQLKALHEISIELTLVDSLDEFYRRTVELGLSRLGFDRIGLFRYDAELNKALGTYGTDTEGKIHPEPHIQFVLEPHGGMWEALQRPERFVLDETGELQHDQSTVGTGWKLSVALRSGNRILGWLVADNLVRQQPVSQSEIEAIAQYGLYVSAALARKETEGALRESEFFLQKSQNIALIGSFYLDIESGTWMSSPMLDEILGIGEHFDKSVDGWISLVHPQHQDEMRQYLSQNVLEAHNRFDKEYQIVRSSDGQERWVHGVGELEFDPDGNAIRMIGTIQDITERKQLQQDLLLTQFCVQTASIGIMRTGANAQILSVNQQVCDLTGYSADELCKLHVYDLDPNFPMERWFEHRRRLRKRGSESFESAHRRKDGTTFPVEITSNYVAFEDNEFSFTFVRDITERKRTERALRLNSFAVEQASDAVYWINEDGLLSDVNEAACRMTGYAREELVGMPASALDAVQTLDEVKKFWRQIKEQGTLAFETRHRTKDGHVFPVEIVVSHIAHENKQLNCAFVRDITQRKLAEEDLKDSQAVLNESQQFSHTGTWVMDIKSGKLTWTDETYRLFGFQPQEVESTFELLLSCLHPDDRPIMASHFQETLKTKVFIPLTCRVILPNEDVRWILNSATIFTDENGEPTRFFGLVQDITERKQAEVALQGSEERLRLSIRVGNVGIFDQDHASGTIYWSPEYRAFFGWEPDGPIPMDAFYRQVHPDDMDTIMTGLQKAGDPTGDGEYNMEHRIIDCSGAIHWLSVRARTFFEGEATARRPVRTVAAVLDITERKRAEAETLRLLEILQASLNEIYVFDAKTLRFQYVNPSALNNLGYTYDEIQRLSPVDLKPEYTETSFREKLLTPLLTQEQKKIMFETIHRRADGTTYPVETHLQLVTQGDAAVFLAVVHDITDRKRAEESLRRLNDELEQRVVERTNELQVANDEIKHFAYIVSHDLRAPLVNLKGFASELREALKSIEATCEEIMPLINQTNREPLLRALHEDVPEALYFIESSVSHMDVFTKAILKLSRMGRQHLDLAEIQTRALVENMLATLAFQIERQNVKIILGDLPPLKADPVSMEQIFGNILSNAILYLDPERPGEIEISSERNDRETTFRIRDNGRGIAKEDSNKVFAPFRRAGKQDMPGEGMGLAYVQALVRRLGGRIWFESEPGKGTTFTFTISNDLTSDLTQS
ncbi:MAG: PAS domain S-box protein [Anaerolineae bacterium]|nr:PAS domain S-box protein [Anaerolineae bacterium]